MKETEFVINLGTADRIREIHARSRGRITSFVVQYETLWHDQWLVVVRYDSPHGFAHRDQYDVRGRSIKTPLLALNYNQALTFAEFDLKANWRIYRSRFFRRRKIMKEAKLVQKNLELSFEFTRYLLAHPEMEEKIPKGAQVVLLPDYDERLRRFNLRISKQQREDGQPVVYVRIKKLNPDRPSRLVGTKIERVA